MKQTKNNYETKTVTPHALYLNYIKKVILELGNFTKWDVKLPHPKYKKISDFPIDNLSNYYATINLSNKKITIVPYTSRTRDYSLYSFLKGENLFGGLTVKLNNLTKSSSEYDFVIYLKNLILDGFNTSLLDVGNSPFSDQEEIFKTLVPITMFEYVVDSKYKESKYIDDEMMEILRTLLSKENIENSVINHAPRVLSRMILESDFHRFGGFNEKIEYYSQIVSKELILKSFAANIEGDLRGCMQECNQKKDLYNFLFVDNDISTDDEIRAFKEKFAGTFFVKEKGPQSSNRIFLRNEVHDGKEFYSLNSRFLIKISNIEDECQRLGCKHIDKCSDEYLDFSEDTKEELEEHYKEFDELQFVFSKALTFLAELDDKPVVNINSIKDYPTSRYNFNIDDYYLSNLINYIKTSNEFFVPVYKEISSQKNIEFVFNEDDDHLGIFYNTQRFERDLKKNLDSVYLAEKILLELEQTFNTFSEIISEENRDELELFQMDLELWKKKVSYFKKVQKKEVYRFVKDKK